MGKVEIALNTVAMLKRAWRDELAPYSDHDIWVAFVDHMNSDEPVRDYLLVTDILPFLTGGQGAE